MDNILVATDFTGCSNNALQFAIGIAKKTFARLTLINVVSVQVIDPVGPAFYMEPLFKEQEENSKKQFEDLLKNLKQEKYPDGRNLEVESITSLGERSLEIIEAAKKHAVDLVICGSKGVDLATRIAGTTALELAELCPVPLLIVPSQAKYKDFQQMLYASDIKKGDEEAIRNMIKIASIYNAKLLIVHVDKDNDLRDLDRFESLKENIRYSLKYGKLDFELIKVDSPSAGLDKLAELEHADLIGLLKYERGFFEDLFHKSIIKEKIYYSEIPLLIFKSQRS